MATWSCGLLALALILQIVNYEVMKPFENPEEWSAALTAKCGGERALKNAY